MQQENDVNCLMNQYLSKIHSLLETYTPLQKVNEMKFLTKPWIIQGLQNFLKNKNDICSKFLKCKT